MAKLYNPYASFLFAVEENRDFSCADHGLIANLTVFVGPFRVVKKVNRELLTKKSPYLETRLASPEVTEITLEEVRSDIFDLILRFLHFNDVKIPDVKIMDTLAAACFLQIKDLIRKCIKEALDMLNRNNCIEIYAEAKACGGDNEKINKMMDESMKMICGNAAEVLKSWQFKNLPIERVSEILESDELKLAVETTVFEAVCGWGEAECERRGVEATPENIRMAADKLIYKIRFPQMTIEDLSYCCNFKPILHDHEILAAISYINLREQYSVELVNGHFVNRRRNYVPYIINQSISFPKPFGG